MTSSGSEIAICVNPAYDWSFNSLNQSPCVVASYLGGVCNSGLFSVPPLANGSLYLGPTLLNTNACRCSSVFYSLISACSLCQNQDFLKWSSYSTNCTPAYTIWPESIPSGTKVPHWAYLNVAGVDDSFNPTSAEAAGDSPESSAVGQATSSGFFSSDFSTGNPGPTNAADSNSSHSSSKAGPIAGGVVGGVVGLALIAALLFWLLRRRRNKLAPSAMVGVEPKMSDGAPMAYNNNAPIATSPYGYNHTGSTVTATYSGATPAPKLYDPSDPSTFPTATNPGMFSAQQDQQSFVQSHHSGPPQSYNAQPGRYTGAPEI